MRVKRIELFEFEDLPWLPTAWRNLQTDFLRQMSTALHLYEPVVPLIDSALARSASRRVVDLCSGAAGPWEQLLKRGWEVAVTLTDRYPNVEAFTRMKKLGAGRIDYRADPVDARQVPAELAGMRVMFNGFHHFRPEHARNILADAAARRIPIGIFEIAELTFPKLLAVLVGVPLLALLLTPFIQPFRFSRLLWTYCLPVVPACLLWDGLASLLRAYTPAQLAELADAAGSDGYRWETGRIAPPFPGVAITYLIGQPED